MEKQRKTRRCIVLPRQNNLDQSSVSEQRAFDVVFVCDAQMAEPLELSKPMNHCQNRRHIGTCCGRQTKLGRVGFSASLDSIRALQSAPPASRVANWGESGLVAPTNVVGGFATVRYPGV